MASILATGVLQSVESTWTDEPLRLRGIEPRPASDWIRQQAAVRR